MAVRIALLVVLALVTLVTPAAAANFAVVIQNFAFSPAQLSIAAGDTVSWTNRDGVAHTVKWTSGRRGESPPLSQGQTYSASFPEAGSFTYICGIHGASMSGSVRVSAPAPQPTPRPPAPTPAPTPAPVPVEPTTSASPSATETPAPSPSPSPIALGETATASPAPAAPPGGGANLPLLAAVIIGALVLAAGGWWLARRAG